MRGVEGVCFGVGSQPGNGNAKLGEVELEVEAPLHNLQDHGPPSGRVHVFFDATDKVLEGKDAAAVRPLH